MSGEDQRDRESKNFFFFFYILQNTFIYLFIYTNLAPLFFNF